jgi:hypothetical protein
MRFIKATAQLTLGGQACQGCSIERFKGLLSATRECKGQCASKKKEIHIHQMSREKSPPSGNDSQQEKRWSGIQSKTAPKENGGKSPRFLIARCTYLKRNAFFMT